MHPNLCILPQLLNRLSPCCIHMTYPSPRPDCYDFRLLSLWTSCSTHFFSLAKWILLSFPLLTLLCLFLPGFFTLRISNSATCHPSAFTIYITNVQLAFRCMSLSFSPKIKNIVGHSFYLICRHAVTVQGCLKVLQEVHLRLL